MTIAVKVSAILILFCCALILATYPVWAESNSALAQDATRTGTTRKEKIQQRVETRKENLAQRLEDRKAAIATREAALKAKLAAFRDRKKAEIVDRINTNLNRINKNHTDHMLRFLDNASRILSRLEERVTRATSDIKDPSAARQAIVDAKVAIDSARSAVQAQAGKDYTLTVSSESRVKVDAQAQRKQLHDDLQAVRKLVIDAKQAVANAIRVAKSGQPLRKEGTPSGQ